MKILIFGRGVISTQYAWAFEKAGHQVEFYVRPGRISDFGHSVALSIFDARKKIRGVLVKENWNISMREELNSSHDYDLIFVSVQHYHLKSVVDFLTDKIGKASLLIFNNLWEEPQEVVSKLPESQLVWGFPGAGGGFDKNGVLNGSLFGSVQMKASGKELTQREKEVRELFSSAGFKIKEVKDLRSFLFSHFVLNAAMHLERLKSNDGTTSLEDLKSTRFWKNVILNGQELIPLLEARNVDLKASSDLKMFSIPPWLISFMIKMVLRFFPPIKQVFTAHSNIEELKRMIQDVMSKADELNIPLPRFTDNKKYFQ